ncbi:MAG: methyltransferase domain-containing protein [Candidatus Eremiobacteraeota bacterium]|nr:methyltransferase domain-containing protein [Candidatus Eremiobacteraeota bacterium]
MGSVPTNKGENRIAYPPDHWIRSGDAAGALAFYLEQQKKPYSRVKTAFIRELLGPLEGKRVLDFGCGGGVFAIYSARSGARSTVAVDAQAETLQIARLHASREGVERALQFIEGDSLVPVKDQEKFDAVVMKDVLEHVIDDRALLSDAAGILAPGGSLVIATQNSFSLNWLIEGSYRRLVEKNRAWCGWDPTHVRFYTPWSLMGKLGDAGLAVNAWRSAWIIPYRWPPWAEKPPLTLEGFSAFDGVAGRVFPFSIAGWNIIARAARRNDGSL